MKGKNRIVLCDILNLVFCTIKYSCVFFALRFGYKNIFRNNTWLISEKRTEARDNGYHMFCFLRKRTRENAYYSIVLDSSDYKKIKELGNVVKYNSFFHVALYLGSKYLLYGQIDAKPYENYRGISKLDFLRRKDQVRVYLKHGIAKDDIWTCDYRQGGYDILICGAQPEFNYYKNRYSYSDGHIAYTGMCRYDGLIDKSKNNKTILLMPTFRNWLRTSDSTIERASESECEVMRNSQFYKNYSSLLKNKRMNQLLYKFDYQLLFYLHYTIQPYVHLFQDDTKSKRITICSRESYDVQSLLNESSVLITDYSSVAFDFAYMYKPLAYYQFDVDQYRKEQYKKGYFDYNDSGFGPVVSTEQDLVKWLEKTIEKKEDGIGENEPYTTRTSQFFKFHDSDNCRRVYQTVLNYKK